MNEDKNVKNLNHNKFNSSGNIITQNDLNLTTEPDNIKNDDININYKQVIQILISKLGFIFILGLIILFVYIIPENHSEKIFYSRDKIIFEKDPIILIHTTDIHLSTKKMERTDGSSIFMMSLYEYNPDLFLLTGDYVDNLHKSQEMGMQNLNDWKMYNTSILDILTKKGFKVIDVSGNHDQWAVDRVTSRENNYLDYSFTFNRENTKTELDFLLRKIKININNIDLTFFLINEYRYPVYRPPYGLEPHISTKQLDLIENALSSTEEQDIFILTHYPIDRAWLLKSSKGNSLEEIISNEKVYSIFTGHEHPRTVKIVHHGNKGGLEFCTASAFDEKRAGLITLDNGNLIYHEVYIPYYGSKPLFFITYPTPNEQLSSHHIFNMNSFDIRVISYVNDKNIKLRIEGDINGNLIYDHTLKNGVLLYKYHVDNLKEGKYNIHIYDEDDYGCDIKTEFTIGKTYKGKKEKYIQKINLFLTIRFLLIPFFIFLFIIVFPFFPKLNIPIVKPIEECIEGNEIDTFNPILKYILFIFLSPFFLRYRLQSNIQIKNVIKYTLFAAFIYPLVLPIHFMKSIKGKVGYSFLVFFVLDEKTRYQHWALQFTFIYYLTTLFPFILFASGKKYYNKNNIIFIIINSLICIGIWIVSMLFNFVKVHESISIGYLFFSTAYIYIFVVLLILFIIFLF